MNDQKWRSPTGHPIASHVTDKLPPKGERPNNFQASFDDLQKSPAMSLRCDMVKEPSLNFTGTLPEFTKVYINGVEYVEAQQQPVDDENNINVLCHDCSKIYEHEYNQPPRHGSCEVCGRKNMLCTRVMTIKARAEQKGTSHE